MSTPHKHAAAVEPVAVPVVAAPGDDLIHVPRSLLLKCMFALDKGRDREAWSQVVDLLHARGVAA